MPKPRPHAPIDPATTPGVVDADYEKLAGFGHHFRQLFSRGETVTGAAGVPPAQFQAMLAIRAHRGPGPMTVSMLADQLFTKLNSAVELAQRLESAGMVRRVRSAIDRRRIELALTEQGLAVVATLAAAQLMVYREQMDDLIQFLSNFSG